MNKSTSNLATAGDRAADAIERWKTGLAFLALLIVAGFVSFIVAAIPMKLAAEILELPYLGSVTYIAPLAAIVIFPWIVTNPYAAKALRFVLDRYR